MGDKKNLDSVELRNDSDLNNVGLEPSRTIILHPTPGDATGLVEMVNMMMILNVDLVNKNFQLAEALHTYLGSMLNFVRDAKRSKMNDVVNCGAKAKKFRYLYETVIKIHSSKFPDPAPFNAKNIFSISEYIVSYQDERLYIVVNDYGRNCEKYTY